jgi:hypothetical protein
VWWEGRKLKANSANGKRTLVLLATLVLVVSFGLPVVANFVAHPAAAAPSMSTSAAVAPTTASAPVQSPVSPHPGTLEIYDVYPGGATTEDPAVAYDTVSYEPIINTFETLITYNGSSSTSYVPVLATCVPGTSQCTHDYGNDLIADNGAGQPVYYTFVIDPQAHFYDPATSASWGVFPTDVMFSVAREMAYAEAIGVGNTPGWLVAQALLPNGSSTWDGGLHAPYNTTPADIYGSMLINDTNYCPAAAMTNAHGCITFVADGQGGPWPFFMQLIGDGFMGTLSCGWYTYEGAGLPGWGNISAANGDGSCLLPNGGTTTQSPAWTSYLAGLNPESWDGFEENLGATYPAPAPNVQWNMVGSGPYYSIVTPTSSPPGYSLIANPAYQQPVGCSGAGGLATYGGYCNPAPGGYIPQIAVYYESSDATGIAQYKAGQADFAGILTTDTGELLTLASQGKLNWYSAHGLSVFFQMPNLNWSSSAYSTAGLPSGVNVPDDFFSGAAARGLMTTAVPYTSMESEANTVDGVQYYFLGGGPIVSGMNGYGTNITYPYENGNPGNTPTQVGTAAWWWHVGTTIGSGYYDPELAACLNSTCAYPIIGEAGASNLDVDITLEINSIESITGDHVQPYTYDLNFGGPCPSLICYQLGGEGPGAAPLPYWNLGWAADNFAPEDYLIPMAFPDSTYTYGDAVYEQFQLAEYNNPTLCGHAGLTLANLTFWAKQPAINSACEGVAYDVVNAFFYSSTHETNTTLQNYEYWAIQAILNDLNLYTWNGQANEVVSAAPWIEGSSINFNPTIGGGNDQYWYQVRYVPYETQVTFKEKGLPSPATTFGVMAGSPAEQNNSNSTTGLTTFLEPNGTLSYSFSPPAGYAVSAVAGPKGTTTTGTTVSGSSKGTVLTVTFVPVNTLTFTDIVSVKGVPTASLPAGTPWGVNISWASELKTGPPNGNASLASFSATTTGSNITFTVPKGSWKFVVQVPTNYKVSASKGAVGEKGTAPTVKALKFTLVASKVVFSEKGLKAGTTWGVNVTGTSSCSVNGTKSSLTCVLVSGTYTVTVWTETGYTSSIASTSLTVVAPKGQTDKVTYTAT